MFFPPSKGFTAAACGALLLSLTATASAESVWYENYTSNQEASIAEVVAATLVSDGLDPKAREMLAGLITSEAGTTQFSVLNVSFPDQTGMDTIVLIIGEDDLTDNDDGWGTVWALEVNLEPRDQMGPYVIQSTTLNIAAG
jgi:hypothetical protein